MALQREQVVQTAEKYVARGKIEPAIREYRKLLAENPNDINTLNRIGDLYARIQHIDEAVEFFNQIGEQYADQGFFVKAIAIYKKIIKLDPTRLEVYERLADLYHKQNLITEARTQYQVLADYYTKHDNAASAIAIYNKMADLEPENPSYHVKLAEIYQNQKLYEKAVNEYRIIAELMIKHGRTQEAAQVYERALTIDSKNLRFIRSAVEALRDAGADAAAAHFLTAAIERNPEAREIAEELRRPRQVSVELEPEHQPEMPAQPAAPAAPPQAAAPPDVEPADELSYEVELDVEDDLMAAMKAAEAAVAGTEAPAVEEKGDELELDLDLDELAIELPGEEEEASSSQVQPPADLGAGHRPGWARQAEEEITLGSPLELEELTFELEGIATEATEAPEATEAEEEAFVLDAELELETELETKPVRTESPELPVLSDWEVEETAAPERDELITEAEVLAKYGLEDKALERLEEALRLKPENLNAYALMIRLHLDRHRHEEVFELAQRMSGIAARTRKGEPWKSVRSRLAEEGYLLNGDEVVAGPHTSKPQAAPELDLELPDLELPDLELGPDLATEPPPPEPPRPSAKPAVPRTAAHRRETAELLRGILGGKGGKDARKPAAPKPVPAPPPAPAPAAPVAMTPPPPPVPAPAPPPVGFFDLTSLGSMIEEEELTGAPAAIPAPMVSRPEPVAPPRSLPFTGGMEDSGVGWLDEAEAGKKEAAVPSSGGAGGGLFDDEDGFFDLAGELVEELSKEEVFQDGLVQQEQSLEEIVEGFKKGVAEHLSPTDYDTHYNLGIAYREMGLLDEAIGEFQLAAKDARHLVISCSMLGLCFLDKGLPELSIKWYRRGLEASGLADDDRLGLMYDLGNAYMAMGDDMSAYGTFAELYGINTSYRDVVAKLEELRK